MVLYSKENPDEVLIVNERGDLRSVPPDSLPYLEESGFFPAAPEHMEALKEREEQRKFMETPGQQIATAAMGGLSGITFGTAPFLMGKAAGALGGKESEETFKDWMRQQEEFNSGLNLAGEIIGTIVPAAVSGGASLLVSGESLAAKTAGKAILAEGLEQTTKSAFGKILSKPIVSSVARNAAEGALQGFGHSVSRQYLEDDPELTSEAYVANLFKDAGIGALAGAAVPVALHGGAELIDITKRRIIDPVTEAVGKVASEQFKKRIYIPLAAFRTDAPREAIEEAMGPLQSKVRIPPGPVADRAANADAALNRAFILDDTERKAMNVLKDKSSNWWEKWRAEAAIAKAERKTEFRKTSIASLTDGEINSITNRFADEVNGQVHKVSAFEAALVEHAENTGDTIANYAAVGDAMKRYQGAVDKLEQNFSLRGEKSMLKGVLTTDSADNQIITGAISPTLAGKNVINADTFKDFLKNPNVEKNINKKLAYDEFNNATENVIDALGPEGIKAYKALPNSHILDSIELTENLNNILNKKLLWDALPIAARKELNLAEMAIGGAQFIGATSMLGPMGKAYAVAKAAHLGADPAADIRMWANIERSRKALADEIGLFGKHFVMPVSEKAIKELPVGRITQSLQESYSEKKRGRKRKQDEMAAFGDYIKLAQQVQRDQSVLQETINSHLAGLDQLPQSRAAAAQRLLLASEWLIEQTPSLRMTDDLDMDQLLLPSKDEIRKFRRVVETINNPNKVIKQMGLGNVSIEAVETLRTVYPRVYQELSQKVLEIVKTKQLSPQEKERARIILGVRDSDIMLLQQQFAPSEPKSVNGRKPTEGTAKRQVEAQMTPSQRLSK